MIPHVAADKLSIRAAAALGLGGVALYVGSYLLWWPLVFIGLAPAAAAFRGLERDRTALAFALVIGWLAMFLVQQSLWAFHTSAVAVLAAYQALTWLPVAFGIRAVWRRWRVPLTFAWPVAWTAGECLRLLGMLGSPFGGIYVPCAAQPVLLQIGELGGIHLASFPVAMAQGWFADTLLRNLDGARERKGFCWPTRAATLAAVATWATVLIFGVVRYRQMEASVRPGPRLAMIQSDIPHVAGEPPTYDPNRLLAKLQRLSEEAVAQATGPFSRRNTIPAWTRRSALRKAGIRPRAGGKRGPRRPSRTRALPRGCASWGCPWSWA
jgi:apolipoprotein N-acyltransferase